MTDGPNASLPWTVETAEEIDRARLYDSRISRLTNTEAPKGTDLSRWSIEQVAAVAAALNGRPRKVLGWRTPAEVYQHQLSSTAQAGVATTP